MAGTFDGERNLIKPQRREKKLIGWLENRLLRHVGRPGRAEELQERSSNEIQFHILVITTNYRLFYRFCNLAFAAIVNTRWTPKILGCFSWLKLGNANEAPGFLLSWFYSYSPTRCCVNCTVTPVGRRVTHHTDSVHLQV